MQSLLELCNGIGFGHHATEPEQRGMDMVDKRKTMVQPKVDRKRVAVAIVGLDVPPVYSPP